MQQSEIEIDVARKALEAALGALRRRLAQTPSWRALAQLAEREGRGETEIGGIAVAELRRTLHLKLDEQAPEWRSLAGIEAALAALAIDRSPGTRDDGSAADATSSQGMAPTPAGRWVDPRTREAEQRQVREPPARVQAAATAGASATQAHSARPPPLRPPLPQTAIRQTPPAQPPRSAAPRPSAIADHRAKPDSTPPRGDREVGGLERVIDLETQAERLLGPVGSASPDSWPLPGFAEDDASGGLRGSIEEAEVEIVLLEPVRPARAAHDRPPALDLRERSAPYRAAAGTAAPMEEAVVEIVELVGPDGKTATARDLASDRSPSQAANDHDGPSDRRPAEANDPASSPRRR